jgi:DNA polymerase III epsilon subunit-like protein
MTTSTLLLTFAPQTTFVRVPIDALSDTPESLYDTIVRVWRASFAHDSPLPPPPPALHFRVVGTPIVLSADAVLDPVRRAKASSDNCFELVVHGSSAAAGAGAGDAVPFVRESSFLEAVATTALLDALVLTKVQRIENKYPSEFAVAELQFVSTRTTPRDPQLIAQNHLLPAVVTPVLALDCEMCTTHAGKELTRCTVVNSRCEVIYDSFCVPENAIIDFNTRYSGIDKTTLVGVTTKLADVQRALLAFITCDHVLVGHSLESDLNALKLVHERVADTSVLFKFVPNFHDPRKNRARSYAKYSLRQLAKEYLGRTIQVTATGDVLHDSREDAVTALDLFAVKVRQHIAASAAAAASTSLSTAVAASRKRKDRAAPDEAADAVGVATAAASGSGSGASGERVRVRSPSPKPAATVIEQRPLTSVPYRGNRDLPLLQPRGVYTTQPQISGMFSTAEPTVGNKLPLVHLPPPKLRVMSGMERAMAKVAPVPAGGSSTAKSAAVGAAAKAAFPLALYPVVDVPVREPPVPTRARQAFVDAWLDFAVSARKTALAVREAEKLAADVTALEQRLFVQSQNAVTYRNLAGQALAKQRRGE